MSEKFYIHLVSDSTGTTLSGLARACLVQFEGINPTEKFWNMIRSEKQLNIVLKGIEEMPGPVIFTLVDRDLRKQLKQRCRDLKVPCIAVLEPIIKGLSHYTGQEPKGMPGLQHQLDERYFDRIDAMDFALHYDDGKIYEGLEEAHIILVGVSRTSKTPTCMYLANRGIRAANIPLVPGVDLPKEIFEFKNPLYVGLTESPRRLVEVRRNRLQADSPEMYELLEDNEYLDEEAIKEEIKKARRLFSDHGWPVIDVTRRSVEETAAEIITLVTRYKPELEVQ